LKIETGVQVFLAPVFISDCSLWVARPERAWCGSSQTITPFQGVPPEAFCQNGKNTQVARIFDSAAQRSA
jgi:hypothetical protein